jgi:hypothetical protein
MLYDNIRESIDCPPDHIINDDDVCDGWLITQSRKNDKDKQEKYVGNTVGKGKMGNATELFIPAKSPEDVQRIQSMNDVGTRVTLAQRQKQIEAKGTIKDVEFADNRIKLTAMTIEAQKQKR